MGLNKREYAVPGGKHEATSRLERLELLTLVAGDLNPHTYDIEQ